MTREEAIEVLKLVEENASCDDCLYYAQMEDCPTDEDCIIVQAVRMAKQALSKEPCDDAISRKDAEQMFRNIRSHLKPQDYKSAEEFNTRDLMLLNAEQMIHALPSVSTTKNIVNHGTMNITL